MLGDRIKELRIAKNLTQAQLAIKVGVTEHAVRNWETNQRSPSVDVLIRIAQFFTCTVDYLLELEEKRSFIEPTYLTLEQIYHIQQLVDDMTKLNANLAKYKNKK